VALWCDFRIFDLLLRLKASGLKRISKKEKFFLDYLSADNLEPNSIERLGWQ
jgi:hypothetical protein